jgi:hypothetical protein
MLESSTKWVSNGSTNGMDLNFSGTIEDITDHLIPKSQIKQAIREILAEMLGVQMAQSGEQRQWYDTDPAYELLDLDEPEQLRDAVRSGLLRIGYEVRDRRKPRAKLPRYQFHIERCQQRLLEKPEKRKGKTV